MSLEHTCRFPQSAPGWGWTCQECWTSWVAVEAGPLDIAWEREEVGHDRPDG